MHTTEKIRKIFESTCIYVPLDKEGIRINHCEEYRFFGTGEDSGTEYVIPYSEVDVESSVFFKLERIDVDSID